jgi:hypothetical protein
MKDKMETALTTASRSEREAAILREAVAALKESWKKEVKLLRTEMKEVTEASHMRRQEAVGVLFPFAFLATHGLRFTGR